MDGDFFRDDGRLQNARSRALGNRRRRAAAVTGPQRVRWDDGIFGLHVQADGTFVVANRYHHQLGDSRLAVENLNAFDVHRFIALALGHEVVYPVGALGIGLVQ